MADKPSEDSSPPPKAVPRVIRTRHSSYHSEGEASGEGGGGNLITDLSQVKVGMRLEAKDKYGKWYAAKVVELEEKDKEVLVHFDRWSSRYDELISVSSGRLQQLSLAKLKELDKEREKVKKQLKQGDRIQARWLDGRMYFGKVVKVHGADVDLLFDDGVEYTAPVVNVRKRLPERSAEQPVEGAHHHHHHHHRAVVEGRRQRAAKRSKKEDSATSTTTTSEEQPHSSPPSSPLSTPPKRMRHSFFDSDSTGMDSDFEGAHKTEPSRSKDGEGDFESAETSLNTSQESTEDAKQEGPGTSVSGQDRVGVVVTSPAQLPPPPLPGQAVLPHGGTSTPFSSKKSPQVPAREVAPGEKVSPQQGTGPAPQQQPTQASTVVKSPLSSTSQDPVPGSSPPSFPSSQKPVPTSTPPASASQKPVPGSSPPSQKAVPGSSPPSLSKPTPTSRPKRTSSRQSAKDTVAARTRAQTKPANVTRSRKVPGSEKSVSKGLPIELDHNEFKCKKTGCNKSFRKLSLLESHIKHYHSPPTPAKSKSKGKASSSLSAGKGSRAHAGGQKSKVQSPEVSKSVRSPTSLTPESSKLASESGAQGVRSPVTAKSSEGQAAPAEGSVKKAEPPADSSRSAGHTATKKEHLKQFKIELTKKGGQPHTSAASTSATPPVRGASSVAKQHKDLDGSGTKKETAVECRRHSASSATSEQGDDVVHCKCGSDVDEGFMIQCEQCLCWQHGDCIGIRSDMLPKKYVCYICCNPPGLRNRLKYKFSREWYGDGTLPSVHGGPPFPPSLNKSILLSHELTDSLYKVKKMIHSSEVKLQAASNPHHPYLKQWAKECSHHSKDSVLAYLMNQLLPVSYQPVSEPAERSEGVAGSSSTAEGVDGSTEGVAGSSSTPSVPGSSSTSESVAGSSSTAEGVAGSSSVVAGSSSTADDEDKGSEGSPVVELMTDVGTAVTGSKLGEGIKLEYHTLHSGGDETLAGAGTTAEDQIVSEAGTKDGDGTVAEIETKSTDGTVAEVRTKTGDGTVAEVGFKTGDESVAEVGTKTEDGTVAEVGTRTGDGTVAEVGIKTGDERMEVTESVAESSPTTSLKRALRSSTIMQKSPCYFSPRKTKKTKLPSASSTPASTVVTPPSDSTTTVEQLPTPSSEGGGAHSPVPSTSSSSIPVSVITQHHSHTASSTTGSARQQIADSAPITSAPQLHVTPVNPVLSHNETPVVAGTAGTSGSEMMEIVTIHDEEFGISEVPVFAVGAPNKPRLPHATTAISGMSQPSCSLPLPLSVITTPTITPSSSSSSPLHPSPLTIATTSSLHLHHHHHHHHHHSPTPTNTFSPSAQSAFKPVTASSSSSASSKSNLASPAGSSRASSSSKLDPSPDPSALKSSPLPTPSAPHAAPAVPGGGGGGGLGMEAMTLGEFAEDFLHKDTSNWFRRMKLLDHIETVQDNVQAWLDMLEKKLDDIPDEGESLENYEKLLSDVQSTIRKLDTVKHHEAAPQQT